MQIEAGSRENSRMEKRRKTETPKVYIPEKGACRSQYVIK